MEADNQQKMAAWRFGAILGEGVRNAAHGGARSTLLVAILALLATVAVIAEAITLQGIRDDEAELWREGSHVVVVSADQGIDGAACEAASTSEAVVVAGAARRRPTPLRIGNLGDAQLTLADVTTGVLRIGSILNPEPEMAGLSLVLAAPAAESLGVTLGETIHARDGGRSSIVTPEAIWDLSYTTNRYSTGLVEVVPAAGGFDTCLLLAAPTHLGTTISAVAPTVLLPNPGPEADARPLVDTDRSFSQLQRQLDERLTRWGGIAAGLLAGLLWMITNLARRPETGLYRSLGLSNVELAALRLVEVFVVSALSFGLGVLASVAACQALGIDGDLAKWVTLSTIQMAFLVQLLAVIVMSPIWWAGETIELVKDR